MSKSKGDREVTLAHEEGGDYSVPISVYVYGHDIDEDAARAFAQRALDGWAQEFDDPDEGNAKHLVNVGFRTHLRKVPGQPGGEYEGWTMFHTGYPAGPGASPIWEFEVDEHLVPRCQITGCNVRWSRGPGYSLPIRMCANHARLEEALFRIDAATRMLQKDWIIGDEPVTDAYFGQWTPERRREWALDHLPRAIQHLERTLREAGAIIPVLAEQGFTLPLAWDAADAEVAA